MSKLKKNIVFYALISFFFASCDKPEIIPAYIYIKPFNLTTDYASEGANTLKVPEAWVYTNNGEALGAFKVPGEVPIPLNGKTDIIIYAGIRNNGSSATPAIYYHYKRFDVSLDLKPGKTDTVQPEITYTKDLTFAWLEDFEIKNTLNLNTDSDTLINFEVVNQGVKYGQKCGLLKVTDKSQVTSVTTKESIKNLPSNQRVYVELDYKGDAALSVRLVGNRSAGGPVELESADFIKAQNEWNKAYVNFRFKDYNVADYPSFNLIFAATIPKDKDGKPTISKAESRIDNIKLVYPK